MLTKENECCNQFAGPQNAIDSIDCNNITVIELYDDITQALNGERHYVIP